PTICLSLDKPFEIPRSARNDKGFQQSQMGSNRSRYSVNLCDWWSVPFESCPVCGYALSVIDHHCRHCSVPSSASLLSHAFVAKYLSTMIMALVAIGFFVYLMFFR